MVSQTMVDATGLFHEAIETIRTLRAELDTTKGQLDEVRDAKLYILQRLTEVKEERDRLIFENEKLKQHVVDLDRDLNGTAQELTDHHCPSCEGGQ